MPIRSELAGLALARGRVHDAALLTDDGELTFAALRDRIDARRHELGATRRLVMIEGANALEPVVTYLAALEAGHPVLFVDGDPQRSAHREALVQRFDPDVIASADGEADAGAWRLDERRFGTRHALHPDLAMLASTSGSTGSPKLVRLSHENLLSNAVAIGDYLNLGTADRAITTLPLHYCYGLSVVNSHLVAGASLRLTERSVVDDGFWNEFADAGATSFAGVPYTFEMLDAAGFAERDLPTLRYITQAGGRLDPERTRRFARLGRDRGFDFVVMYGQTEATARMAYLPPRLAESAAGSIGIPIPGGRFRIDVPGGTTTDAAPGAQPAAPPADGAVGELVYQGPNVMMGYAEEPADFAMGRTITELRTGDLARRRDDGMYEVVGRNNRFAKIFGLRIDLDRVERLFADEGLAVRAVSADEQLLLFVLADRFLHRVHARAGSLFGLPLHAIRVHAIAEFPRTSNGKPDNAALVRHAELLAHAASATGAVDAAGATAADTTPETIRSLFAELLGRPDASRDDSFAGLGGDSLSYVEVSLRLEQLLGALPRAWPTMTVSDLAGLAAAPAAPAASIDAPGAQAGGAHIASASARATARGSRPRRRMPRLETPAVLRSIAIVLVVGTHANLFTVPGGAHLLLAVAGYNLARFQLADVPGRGRVAGLLKSGAQVVAPAALWIGAVGLITGGYAATTALFVNNFAGGAPWSDQWQFWFLEAIVWSMIALAAVFAVPQVDRLERRHPFAFALGVLALAMAARVLLLGGVRAEGTERYAIETVVWCIALGWVVARASTRMQRILVSALALVSVPGFFGDPAREAIVVVGVLLLVWVPRIPVTRLLVPVIGALASASMFIYLTHWQVYPPLENDFPALATVLSLVVGVVVWKGYTLVVARGGAWLRRRRAATRRR
ncbi:AMP-binding protein [Agromyces sp. SYSU K20354]|uniref:AMP-binding protein n=1 Tax=Agromyces cavernae TaxID=2898659 RepID=UPI001E4D9BEF|nr:AMP-binding protein [Agromyces cavernae]MCD2440748.1 AMP-binding protein [Agromyces cavernae]